MSEALQIPVAGIVLSATHTHCAPATVFLRYWGTEDAGYKADLCGKLVDVARRAAAINFGCHPVNLHQSGMITPDFPYHVERAIRGALGDIPVLYLAGPGGDVNPVNFDYHAIAAIAAIAAMGRLPDTGHASLSTVTREISIPLAPLPSGEELREILAVSREALQGLDAVPTNWDYTRHATYVEWAEAALRARDAGDVPEAMPLTTCGIRLGDAAIVTIPGELFTIYGKRIRDAANGTVPFVVTLANGFEGYFASPLAHEHKTYEAVYCPRHIGLQSFASVAAETLTRVCEELMNEIAGEPCVPEGRET